MPSTEKKNRISAKKNFRETWSQGRKISFPYFLIKYKTKDTGTPRLGMLISKKKFLLP